MSEKILYCVRHGKSEENETKIFSAGKAPLTSEGLVQARRVAKKLAGKQFDFVHSSPYLRAVQTADEIVKAKHMKGPQIIDYAYEYAYLTPKHEGVSAYSAEYQEIHKRVYEYWQKKSEELPAWSESFEDFLIRVERFMSHYNSRDFNSGVFVGHAFFFKLLKARVVLGEGLDSAQAYALRENTHLSNTSITIYKISDNKWTLLRWNDDEHLSFDF